MLGVIDYSYRPVPAVFKDLTGNTIKLGDNKTFPWFNQLKNNTSNFVNWGDYALAVGENDTPTSKDDYAFSLDTRC